MSYPPTGPDGPPQQGYDPNAYGPPAGDQGGPYQPYQGSPPPQGGFGSPVAYDPGYQQQAPAQQPYPGAQMSGPPFGEQMSGPPVSASPAPAAAPKKSQTVLILGIVAGLLFVLGGVMTGLYVAKSNELSETRGTLTAQVKERDTTITTKNTELEKLKTDLSAATKRADTAEQNLTGTQNDRDEQVRQKQIISKCLELLSTALTAAAAGNQSAYDAAVKDLDKTCDEANKYL
ncbi:hypothetical protein [Polymorphospora lycopeni]|uniref:Uncharacterized protein n=1 Tax=Polymorphospora lycopeni TaxID=3140240 RepID=A0ABV5CZD1_9ACTN